MFLEDKQKFVLPEVKTDPVAECLLRAAQIIRDNGWTQGHYNRHGASCMVGAIYRADRDPKIVTEAVTVMWSHGRKAEGWNDTPGRTAAEVIAALEDAAADILKAK